MPTSIAIQHTATIEQATVKQQIPGDKQIEQWCQHTLQDLNKDHVEICIRIVDENESASLNQQYRQKTGATNVLSFPADIPEVVRASEEMALLGDLVICASVVETEAAQQQKSPDAHWAHMVVHGTLHLLGYDHIEEADARKMEAREVDILSQLGFTNPY